MIKLLTVEESLLVAAYKKLREDNPDWVFLDMDRLRTVFDSVYSEYKSDYNRSTFLVPYDVVNRRSHNSKLNKMLSYLCSVSRPREWTLIIVAPSLERVDLRLRRQIGLEEKYEVST